MATLNPRLLRELKGWVPDICEDHIVELAASNLDLYEPQKKVKSIKEFDLFYFFLEKIIQHPEQALLQLLSRNQQY